MGRNLVKPPSLLSMSTLSSYPPRSKGPMSSPTPRTYAMSFPRQLAPIMVSAPAGVEISGRSMQGMEGFVSGRITKNLHGKLHVDRSTWGCDIDSVGLGTQVAISSINIFIGK